jgi:4-hydroxy-tetrahydrodipicolinate synthase
MFKGTYTALVTPFKDGKVDEKALVALIRSQVAAGIDGLVPVGTTGESPTLDCEEHLRVIEIAIQEAAGKVKVLAGTGGNATQEAIHLTQEAQQLGAHGSLQVAPYYNKPSQEGLYQHFEAIAKEVELPIILYSIPGRCHVSIEVPTVKRLAQTCPHIVGIKEAGGDADRVSQLRQTMGSEFTILSGDDGLTLPFMSVGAEGVISVASNVIPESMVAMVRACQEGRFFEALEIHERFHPLFKALFMETNPVPVKEALHVRGALQREWRLPLVGMHPDNLSQLIQVMKSLELV